jgi:hypothetical protein
MLWSRLYGRATAERQQALAGLVDRSVGYEQALLDARVQTRLGEGSIDIDVQGELVSPFTGAGIKRLAVGATWLRNSTPGSSARVVGNDKLVHRFLGTDHLRRIHVIHDGLYPGL